MDMVEDAQLAIEAFGGKPGSDGQRYLEEYGLLQAISSSRTPS
jgi:inosine/xanthosine triphosphate pyrophosphatase family protein